MHFHPSLTRGETDELNQVDCKEGELEREKESELKGRDKEKGKEDKTAQGS